MSNWSYRNTHIKKHHCPFFCPVGFLLLFSPDVIVVQLLVSAWLVWSNSCHMPRYTALSERQVVYTWIIVACLPFRAFAHAQDVLLSINKSWSSHISAPALEYCTTFIMTQISEAASLPSNKVRHKMLKSLILSWESDKNWRNTKARYKKVNQRYTCPVSVCRIFCLFLKKGTPVRFLSCSVRFLSLEKSFYPFLTFEITRIKILAPVFSGRDWS